jgi:PAS domain S-box-containing protein
MKSKEVESYEALTRALDKGRVKGDGHDESRQVTAIDQTLDESLKRYEHLASATKTFIFTVLIKEGIPVCTIHYPGVHQVTGYTAAEYAAQPLLWCSMIHSEDQQGVLNQIARLLKGETPGPIKHRIRTKDGTIRWLRNTSVPVFDRQGKLTAYDGLVADISESEFHEATQGHLIDELTEALKMVKTLHSLLPICCSCKNIRDDQGYWQQMEAYIAGHYPTIGFSHGLCPDCAKMLYPDFYEEPVKVV